MQYVGEVLALGVTLGFAWVLDWQAADLVWSLWLSSLSVGYLIVLSQCLHLPLGMFTVPRAEWRGYSRSQIVGGVLVVFGLTGLLLAFFTFHFGFFHYVHGSLVDFVLPPDGVEYPSSAWGLPAFAWALAPRYYGMVIASALLKRRAILKPEGFKHVDEPYRGVVRMHLLIVAFFALYALGATNFTFYTVTLIAFFFPWKALKREEAGAPVGAPTPDGG